MGRHTVRRVPGGLHHSVADALGASRAAAALAMQRSQVRREDTKEDTPSNRADVKDDSDKDPEPEGDKDEDKEYREAAPPDYTGEEDS